MRIPRIYYPALSLAQSFNVPNSYGLFRVMTKERREIVLEGSNDGQTWKTYEFKWKPGDPNRRPSFVEPHLPRLDWQMWFAALRPNYQSTPWFPNLVYRMLEGSDGVLGLLKTNPFQDAPPAMIRAQLYDYRFTNHGDDGWWKREYVGEYAPAVGLGSGMGLGGQ